AALPPFLPLAPSSEGRAEHGTTNSGAGQSGRTGRALDGSGREVSWQVPGSYSAKAEGSIGHGLPSMAHRINAPQEQPNPRTRSVAIVPSSATIGRATLLPCWRERSSGKGLPMTVLVDRDRP